MGGRMNGFMGMVGYERNRAGLLFEQISRFFDG